MQNLAPDIAQQRALAWAIALATAPVPGTEQQLAAFARQLPAPPPPRQAPEIYHLLYCRQPVQPLDEEQLADLLETSLAGNVQSGLRPTSSTGLLPFQRSTTTCSCRRFR